ncbi:helix-turn-helix domain-containing protein [Murinocardiopsis flavida]|uniref:helix-turn-helix domain-containing protein n=1 Tax=Murinocardiopsis flavida TaxID=645275 RepID=UPI000D0D26A6|nr:helix-turn-helix transcriptional regulator [Murinocardiopsis flavida]
MTGQEFGTQLAKERKQAGHTQRALASLIQGSASSLCRWENGQATPPRGDVEKIDKALESRGRLIRMWELATSGTSLPPWMRDIGRLEEAAETIELISPHVVPGLLQSPLYAHMVMREGLHPGSPTEIKRLVSVRCSRYDLLRSRGNPWVIAVFPKTALTCVPEPVRTEQVAHLLSLIGSSKVLIHLLPEGTLLVGVTSMLLMFHLRDGGKAASADHVWGNVLYEETSSYDQLDGLVKRSLGSALPPEQTRMALEELR